MREWLPEGHLALFVLDLVTELDLSPITAVYEAKDARGRAGYHPAMMVALLVYAYCVGRPSSRRIERATYEDVAFRVLAGGQHPDHDCIAAFRKEHLGALSGLFVQVLRLCRQAGLVKLGHVAIDGTKVKANASKHKAMSYERMGEAEKKLQHQVDALLSEAVRIDAEEDRDHGKGKRDDGLPKELARRESRLAKIREAKAALEREAKEAATARVAEVERELAERVKRAEETGKAPTGRKRVVPDPQAVRVLGDRRRHRHELPNVVRRLRQQRRHDDLRRRIHRDLRVVGLHERALVRPVGHDHSQRSQAVPERLLAGPHARMKDRASPVTTTPKAARRFGPRDGDSAVRERSGSRPYMRPPLSRTMTRTSTFRTGDSQESVGLAASSSFLCPTDS
jgi:transposase